MSVFSDSDVDEKIVTPSAVERLILAQEDDRSLSSAIDSLGLAETAAVLVDEVLFRCDAPGNDAPFTIALDITWGEDRISFPLAVQAGRPVRVGATDAPVALHIEYDAADLLRELFGPTHADAPAHRRTEMRFIPETVSTEGFRRLGDAMAAAGTILTGCTAAGPGLDRLALRYGSDKWGGLHWFTPLYERHLHRLRDRPVRVLEIGIGGYGDPHSGGGSLKMWKHYFPRGLVFGVDLFDKSGIDQQRLRTLKADQSDPDQLLEIAEQHGPFDVVIDDGSHINEHIRTAFQTLFPHIRPGGFYVIEDLWTSYVPGYGGNEDPSKCSDTSLGMIKRLVDDLHYQEQSTAPAPGGGTGPSLTGMHIYHNIAFLEKGRNAEGGVPPWVPRTITY